MGSLTITFRRDGKTPLYYQLYQFIVEEIRSGHYREGEKMPSETSLVRSSENQPEYH